MYYEVVENTVERDNLQAAMGVPEILENVSVSGGVIERGMIICGTNGIYEPVTKAADANKPLAIAEMDYNSSDVGVISAYTGGSFHMNALKTGSSIVSAEDFKEPLRKENIIVINQMEV